MKETDNDTTNYDNNWFDGTNETSTHKFFRHALIYFLRFLSIFILLCSVAIMMMLLFIALLVRDVRIITDFSDYVYESFVEPISLYADSLYTEQEWFKN